MITPKERLERVMKQESVDRPPCICPGGMMNMITTGLMDNIGVYLPEAHHDPMKMAMLAKEAYHSGCFENYGVPFCMTVEAESMGAKVDFGSKVHEPHVIEYLIESVEQWKELPKLQLDQGRVATVLESIRILKAENGNVPIIGNLTGPISVASSLIEPVVFYKELRKKNEAAHEYMEFITDQLIAFGKAQIEAGADVIAISDPSGTGELLGPKYFKEFAVTYINRLLNAFDKEKAKTIVHICGHMNSVYKQVNEIQSNALSFDSVVSMKEAREQLKNRVLMGNVTTYALEFGEPEKIRTLTKHCVKNGANIISPACGLGMKSPLSNIQAMLQSLQERE